MLEFLFFKCRLYLILMYFFSTSFELRRFKTSFSIRCVCSLYNDWFFRTGLNETTDYGVFVWILFLKMKIFLNQILYQLALIFSARKKRGYFIMNNKYFENLSLQSWQWRDWAWNSCLKIRRQLFWKMMKSITLIKL